MLIPYKVDVPMSRRPIANYLIIVVTVVFFFLCTRGVVSKEAANSMVLGASTRGWLGHLLLHDGLWHLLGNMLFLWVFGNAVCAKIGNVPYLALYLALGLAAAATHMHFDGDPAVGASGAINGIIGVFLIWYPVNTVSCFYYVLYFLRTFTVRAFWMILLWLAFDIFGAVFSTGRIAYHAHLGGFFAGAAIGVTLLLARWIEMGYWEKSLLVVLHLTRDPERLRRPSYQMPAPASGAQDALGAPRAAGWGGPPARDGHIAAGPASPAGSGIRFQCRCGRDLMASRYHAGRQTRCPYCNTPIRIPDGEDEDAL